MNAIATDEPRVGDFIETATGRRFWPLDPRPDEVDIEDIATALANQCRYSGHVKFHWSVAAHSLWVAELCPPEAKLWALLHDAPEAYCVDVPRPVKRHAGMAFYRTAERALMRAICLRYDLDAEEPEDVKRADNAMLWWEANALMTGPLAPYWWRWKPYADSFGGAVEVRVIPKSPAESRSSFLAMFHHLTDGRFA